MQLRGLWRLSLIAMLAIPVILAQTPASAQPSALDADARARLSAIPLASGELPDGFGLAWEGFVLDTENAYPNVDARALADAGFAGMYSSIYQNPDTGDAIISYASQWEDAEAGFALAEDEAVTNPGVSLTDAELDAGTGSAEITTGAVETETGSVNITDASFVVDRYTMGVTVQVSPESPIDAAAVTSMVEALEARATSVIAGTAPAGADLALPVSVLDIRSLGVEQQAGFLSSAESETLYGVSGSSLSGIQVSWVSTVSVGEDGAPPYVAMAVSTFESADNAARVVEQSADLIPVTVELQPVDGFAVEGTDSVRGYQYASQTSTDGAVDSFRGVAQVGASMIVVDVQGAASPEAAQAAVSELIAAQVTCAGGGECQAPEVDLGA
jgi:hypothetical protein